MSVKDSFHCCFGADLKKCLTGLCSLITSYRYTKKKKGTANQRVHLVVKYKVHISNASSSSRNWRHLGNSSTQEGGIIQQRGEGRVTSNIHRFKMTTSEYIYNEIYLSEPTFNILNCNQFLIICGLKRTKLMIGPTVCPMNIGCKIVIRGVSTQHTLSLLKPFTHLFLRIQIPRFLFNPQCLSYFILFLKF